jgi:hypothetical protein
MTYPQLRYAMVRSGFRIVRVEVNRAKPQSYPHMLLYPYVALYTHLAFGRERDRGQRKRNVGIARTILSPKLLLGETLIIKADKANE